MSPLREWAGGGGYWHLVRRGQGCCNTQNRSHKKELSGQNVNSDEAEKPCLGALFTIARTWKQPQCPSTDEWIKKMWHMYTMEYYSAIKRNKIELLVVRWMDLESVIQSEVSQKEKNKYRMLTHVHGI